ncbi:unnamed protein product, partial [Rotaria magnacalcarata]
MIFTESNQKINEQVTLKTFIDKWQMIIRNYWPLLTKFQFYSELWYLTS